ncbi:hypothetical protein KZZ07_21670 [Mameliella sp. CS4]|uniref:hypothetical protein n=1 Tax=Mameliella sp. CS4 TaxID=2862329 RepID=UPI001C5F04DE|nr:hypothetical protein [Mameliella sp. CS4]MBW4985156.1 hypothetical protein [Mameliella sp. CS4]
MPIAKLVKGLMAVSVVFLTFVLWTSGIIAGLSQGALERRADIRNLPAPDLNQKVVYIDFMADARTVYETGWDGLGHVSGVTMGLFLPVSLVSPPDLTLCVSQLGSTSIWCSSPADSSDRKTQLSCHDSLSCGWALPARDDIPLVAVVLDRDDHRIEGPWDLLDAVILLPRNRFSLSAEDDAALREKAAGMMETLSPTRLAGPDVSWAPGEALRRLGAVQIVTQNDARSFAMSQGTITLYPEGEGS